MMNITFLGTGCMKPTKDRNHQAVLVSVGPEYILLDCGENVQRQLRIAKIKPNNIRRILISHWHGDHVLGLPGLIQTMSAEDYEGTLFIYGPTGTKARLKKLFEAFIFDRKIILEVKDIGKGVFFSNSEFILEAALLDHKVPTLAFSVTEVDKRRINIPYVKKIGIPDGPLLGQLQNNKQVKWKSQIISPKDATHIIKGKKLAYVTDTVICKGALEIAKNADALICEAVYTSNLKEKALKFNHLTAKDAAFIATKANVKKLILTHFSQRYKTTIEIENEASTYFKDVVAANDFMKFKV